MRKKELIEVAIKIAEGFEELKNLLISEESCEPMNKPEEPSIPNKEEPYTKEHLDSMKYNDLKKLGANLGIDCKGTREQLVNRILSIPATPVEPEPEPEEEAPVDETPVEEAHSKVASLDVKRKGLKKKTEEKPEDEETVSEANLQLAREAVEENGIEDVIAVLEDAGVKITACDKKKQDVIVHKLAEAFENGLIDAEVEPEEEKPAEEEEPNKMDITPESYFPQYDPEGLNDPEVITPSRLKAIRNLVADILEKVNNAELTEDDTIKELEDICTEEDIKLLGEDYEGSELLAFYIEMQKRFVDDEGYIIGAGEPYVVNETNFCCGHELTYDKKSKKFVCAVCEASYEEDDD